MSDSLLLAEVQDLGITLLSVDGRLRVDAPIGAMSDELRAALVEHKAEVLALLSSPTWEQLSAWRWGPSIGDPEPGIEVPTHKSMGNPNIVRVADDDASPDPIALAHRDVPDLLPGKSWTAPGNHPWAKGEPASCTLDDLRAAIESREPRS